MKRHLTLSRIVIAFVIALIAILVSLLRRVVPLPAGFTSFQAVLPVLMTAWLVLGWWPGWLSLIITGVATLFMSTANLLTFVSWLLAALVAMMMERRWFNRQLVLNQHSLMVIGLVAALGQVIFSLLLTGLAGWRFFGIDGARIFVLQSFGPVIGSALLTALLTAPLTMLLRQLLKRFW